MLTFLVTALAVLSADADPIKPIPRRLPPEGIEIPPSIEKELRDATEALRKRFDEVRPNKKADQYRQDAGDVLIFVKAVDFALRFREFYSEKDFSTARQLLAEGNRRCDALAKNERPWTRQKGRVVRGYLSQIDDSPQPFGVEIPDEVDVPANYDFTNKQTPKGPLYVWLHGRGDKQTDLHFIQERMTRPGQIHPQGAIVVHPFGRSCLGFKSAGEVDVLEVTAQAYAQYPVESRKIVLIGFSMGGAGAWHLGVHYAGMWAAVAPGAGFAETQRYQKLDASKVPWYERTLWGQNDAPAYVRNLLDRPVIAYSGEIDPQKQAADVMAEAFAAEGEKLKHLIGPGMPHKYHPDSLKEILAYTAAACDRSDQKRANHVHIQTRTLRYPGSPTWVSIRALEEHWRDTRVDAEVQGEDAIRVTTKNVTALAVNPPLAKSPYRVLIDGQTVVITAQPSEETLLVRREGKWASNVKFIDYLVNGRGKTVFHQGPIDDAFAQGSFLVVRPTGKCRSAEVQKWVDFELAHFLDRWRATFRGEARVKDDVDMTEDDLTSDAHLILWGDDQSNKVIARLNDRLPIRWDGKEIVVGPQRYAAARHMPLLIWRNPFERPNHVGGQTYIVINSGPTFREAHDATNSQQNPKLPDWAIVDLSQPPDDKSPGKIVAADFFDEEWKLKPLKE